MSNTIKAIIPFVYLKNEYLKNDRLYIHIIYAIRTPKIAPIRSYYKLNRDAVPNDLGDPI